jgi:outer membrane protein assembly factor BamD
MNKITSITIAGLVFLAIFVGSCTNQSVKLASSAHEQFQWAKKEYEKKHYLKAIEGFQKTIFNFPGATIVDSAQYYLALSYYNNKEYELAAVEFSRLIANYPRSGFNDDAQYMVGMCYLKNTPGHYALDQEDLKKAIVALEDFILDNPDSPLATQAKSAIGEARGKLAKKEYRNGITYFRMYAYEASRVYFQFVIDEYTDTEYASKALFKMAESYYKQDKFSEAEEKFRGFLNLYPDHELASKAYEYLEKFAKKLKAENAPNQSE